MAQDFVTADALQKFATDLEKFVKQAITNEEIEFSKVVKEYIDEKLTNLEASIVNSEDWKKIKSTIDALIQVFDANSDGTLTPEEVLTKIGELKGAIDAVAKRVDTIESDVKDIKTNIGAIQTDINNVKSTIDTVKSDIEKEIGDSVTAVKSEVQENVAELFDEVSKAITGAFENTAADICERMNAIRKNIFGLPEVDCSKASSNASSTDTSSDGATL